MSEAQLLVVVAATQQSHQQVLHPTNSSTNVAIAEAVHYDQPAFVQLASCVCHFH